MITFAMEGHTPPIKFVFGKFVFIFLVMFVYLLLAKKLLCYALLLFFFLKNEDVMFC
jgi:hypothetical protein